MRTRGRALPRLTGVLSVVVWSTVLAYVVGLTVQGTGFVPVVDLWLNVVAVAMPALLCWATVLATPPRQRLELILVAVGASSYAIGNAVLASAAAGHIEVSTPGWSDLGFLLFYPAILAALVVVVRRDAHRHTSQVWWDAAVGALGAATCLAVALRPVFAHVDGAPLQMIVALAYPVADMVLVAVLLGMACLYGARVPLRWLPLIAGLGLFAVADVIYTLRMTSGGYTVGTPMDGLWAVGLAGIATWAVHRSRERHEPAESSRSGGQASHLYVPALSTGLALVVLLAASVEALPRAALVLAAATIVVSAGRTHAAYRQLWHMTDLARQARVDDLTGLANRRAFYELATRRTAAGQGSFALLLIDLDRFKDVNDGLGHHVGDQLLVQVGQRLLQHLRPGDVLARLGGDEFAVIAHLANTEEATRVADRLQEALVAGFDLDALTVHAGASIGVALYPRDGEDVDLLLRRADIAMYQAKAGRHGYQLWAAEAGNDTGADRLRLLHQLREALHHNELVLHYQPKIDLGDDGVRSVEALVRWQHPQHGLLYPATFLPLAENAGLMHELTIVVLHQALAQTAQWHAAGHRLSVAVNLPAASLMDAHLAQRITDLLDHYRLPASALQLEITEDAVMGDRDRAVTHLIRLRHSGVQIAIDDFGTGFSSLAYLRDLPVDELKLDRSFIAPASTDHRAAALVASTVTLAHSLGLRMVAEGVESPDSAERLKRFGCDQAQGYLYSRPVPADEVITWIIGYTTTPQPSTGEFVAGSAA